MTVSEIKKKLKKELKKDRYEHTLGVAYTGAALAMRYDTGLLEQAMLAGLLHDCAKGYDAEDLLDICESRRIPFSDAEYRSPSLLHAKVGALLAEREYGIKNPDILSAITYHTTGKPQMSLLEQIVFVADYIEPNRNKAQNLELIRKTSFENLELAIYYIARDTLTYLRKKEAYIDSMTVSVYQYYKNKLQIDEQ